MLQFQDSEGSLLMLSMCQCCVGAPLAALLSSLKPCLQQSVSGAQSFDGSELLQHLVDVVSGSGDGF